MKDMERIDRVLQGLREAEPADGLELRVLRAVEARAAAKTPSRFGGLWRVFPVMPRWYAVAAAVLVLTVLLGLMGWQNRQRGSGRDGAGIARRVQLARRPAAAPALAAAAQPDFASPRGGPEKPRAKARRVARRQQATLVVALRNHPAPEPPLTDEERLLLRLTHRAAPAEFEVLNPDARDAQAKSDKAEFRKFFGPPPTGDSE